MESGVVIQELGEGSVLESAGLEPGDVVLSWERLPSPPANPQAARGRIESVFDWTWLEVEQAPRGTVKLTVRRRGEVEVFDVVLGEWNAAVRAPMPERMLADYSRGKDLIEAEDLEAGIDLWHKAAGTAENLAVDERLRCWLFLEIGDAWTDGRQWKRAHGAYRLAIASAQDPRSQVTAWLAIAEAHEGANEFESAREAHLSAQEIRARSWGESLVLARGLGDLGVLDHKLGGLESAQESFQRSLDIRQRLAPGSLDVAWSLNSLGGLNLARGDLDRAAEYIEQALEIRQRLAPGSLSLATSLNNLGIVAYSNGDIDRAAEYHERSLEIRQRLAPGSLDVAGSLNNLGWLARERGHWDRAVEYNERALEIYQRLVPGSLDVAGSLNNLGALALAHGDSDRAAEYLERSLEISQRLAPESLDVALTLNNLGILAGNRGEIHRSIEYHGSSLKIRQKLAPGSLDVADSLNNLGVLARDRGDLGQATEFFERALEIRQNLTPESLVVAGSLMNLGGLARDRGDLDQATKFLEWALEIRQRLAPGSLVVASSLTSMGILTHDRGDLDLADKYYERSLEIQQELAPASLDMASNLVSVGIVAHDRGDLDRAADYYKRSLEIRQKLAPGSLVVAKSLINLGLLAHGRGELDGAAGYFEMALEIQKKLAPGTAVEARILYDLATIRHEQNRPRLAFSLFHRSLQALENQLDRFGSSRDAQADFRSGRLAYYRDTINTSLELRRSKEAFHILERSRAQSFLAQLAERDLIFSDLPERLDLRRRQIAYSYDRTLAEIGQLNPENQTKEIEALRDRLQELRWERDDVTEEILKVSPRLGALRYPRPLDFPAAKKALDPGTVMLSYSVGEESTDVFVLASDSDLRVRTLAIGKTDMQDQIRKWTEVIPKARPGNAIGDSHSVRVFGKRLYKQLIEPVADAVAEGERLLIIPDGPLHVLPWSALIRESETDDEMYLAEWKPFHTVLSATVYAQLKQQRPTPGEEQAPLRLAAFGDPHYSGDGESLVDFRVRAAAHRGLFDGWESLPHTRREVEQIAALYPTAATRTYLGTEATEEAVKAVGRKPHSASLGGGRREVDILHLAAHGYLDDRSPFDSAIVLTLPQDPGTDRDNGLLQVWEIFEGVRLDTDLVVLSACDSGVGTEQAGEGLIGLTRAFQYAGARSVVASLWNVQDQATAELMVRFYRHLNEGLTKDEALRAAQLELIRGEIEVKDDGKTKIRDFSAPYYWAPFQIYGDWQ